MTEVLTILEDYLIYRKWKYERIDGSVKIDERQASIKAFNENKDIFVFLLSTRSGGLGINLAGADTVILYDSDWNPHQDLQAQDRAHRIGQKNNVCVYRFLTAGSVEIEMMEKQMSKLKLERLSITGGDFRKAGKRLGGKMTSEKLRILLEDDVRNLAKRAESFSKSTSNSKTTNDTYSAEAISEKELDLITDREKLFETLKALENDTKDDMLTTTKNQEEGEQATKRRKVSPRKKEENGKNNKDEGVDLHRIPIEGDMYDILQFRGQDLLAAMTEEN